MRPDRARSGPLPLLPAGRTRPSPPFARRHSITPCRRVCGRARPQWIDDCAMAHEASFDRGSHPLEILHRQVRREILARVFDFKLVILPLHSVWRPARPLSPPALFRIAPPLNRTHFPRTYMLPPMEPNAARHRGCCNPSNGGSAISLLSSRRYSV